MDSADEGQFWTNLGLRSSALQALELDQAIANIEDLSDDLDCSALERFSINSLSLFLSADARLRGLRSLRVDKGFPSGLCQRRVLSHAEIQDLGRYCCKLRRLGLDIAYNGRWVSLS